MHCETVVKILHRTSTPIFCAADTAFDSATDDEVAILSPVELRRLDEQ